MVLTRHMVLQPFQEVDVRAADFGAYGERDKRGRAGVSARRYDLPAKPVVALVVSCTCVTRGSLVLWDLFTVLVSEDKSQLSLLSVLDDLLRPLSLPAAGRCTSRDVTSQPLPTALAGNAHSPITNRWHTGCVEQFAGHGALLVSVVSLNSGSASETRIGYVHDLARPARPFLLGGNRTLHSSPVNIVHIPPVRWASEPSALWYFKQTSARPTSTL